jgi:hypothetical protein
VTELEHRREVLLARIDAHRALLDLEVRCARASMSSMTSLLGVFGLDGAVAGAMVSGMRTHDLTAALPLLVAAVLRVLASTRGDEPEPPAS